MVNHLQNLHDIANSNIIIGDFNFIDNELDKGSGFSSRDKVYQEPWGKLLSDLKIVDPFRTQYPQKKIFFCFFHCRQKI